jgi:NAD(P)-dependent dehydrogenase (short-subunit alcohol dehydrogenase family)
VILQDEVVVVTGIGAGMGAKLSARIAAEGGRVVMVSRSTDVMEGVQKEIEAAGGEALCVPANVVKEEECARVAAAAVERFGRITGLVNSAYAHPGFHDLLETPDKLLRRAMEVSFFGALQMTKAVVPHMKTAGRGSIVNIGTMTTRKPMRGEGGYAAAKAAMSNASQMLALELGEHNIRVNEAVMGWLDGPGVQFYLQMTADEKGITTHDVYDDIASRNPLGRIPRDEDCAKAVVFLLSDYASEMTGAVLDVNGGEYMSP